MSEPLTATTTAALEAPAVHTAAVQVAELPTLAESLAVNDPESFAAAGELLKICGQREALVDRELDGIRADAHKAWKGIVAKIAELKRPAEQARGIIGRKMADYDRACREAKARAEREAAAERDRLAREAQARLDEAAAAERERQRAEELLVRAAEVEAGGDAAGADALLQEAAVAAETGARAGALFAQAEVAAATPAPIARYVPQPVAQGVAMRSTWRAEVVDFAALVQFVAREIATGKPSAHVLELLAPNGPALDREARSLKSVDLGIPGVRGVEDRAPARTGR